MPSARLLMALMRIWQGVDVSVTVGLAVMVGEAVAVSVGVGVGVAVGEVVQLLLAVNVGVNVRVPGGVGLRVGETVKDGVLVLVGVRLGVEVGLWVLVGVGGLAMNVTRELVLDPGEPGRAAEAEIVTLWGVSLYSVRVAPPEAFRKPVTAFTAGGMAGLADPRLVPVNNAAPVDETKTAAPVDVRLP